MKNILLITAITLVIVVIALFFLPDQMPLHWGPYRAGNVGSKYVLLVLVPVPGLIYWGFTYKKKK